MNINKLKNAATVVASIVVAGATAKKIMSNVRKDASAEEFSVNPEFTRYEAFSRAQDIITERVLSGYYDAVADSVARHDFDVLFNTFYKN